MPKTKTKVAEAVAPTIVVQQNNSVLYLILAVLVVALAFMFVKMTNLEKKLAGGGVQAESHLSLDNLKKYAKEIGLDTGKFNKCLDSGGKKETVTAETNYGTSVGVQGTPAFFINGRFVGGAYPFSSLKEIIDKELAGTGSNDCSTYTDQSLSQTCDSTPNGDDPEKGFKPIPRAIDTRGAQAKGPADAKVQVVEFSDFECPFCIRAYPTVQQILKEYDGKVRLYYMQYPLNQIHPNAEKAAEASLCAADQGKFWEYHDKMFEAGVAAQGQ